MLRLKFNSEVENFANLFFNNAFNTEEYVDKTNNANIIDNDDSYQIEIQLPGFKKSDIKIGIENEVLTISSKVEKTTDKLRYVEQNFTKNSFENKFKMNKYIDKNNITAKMEDGILTVILGKIVEDKTKQNTFDIKID